MKQTYFFRAFVVLALFLFPEVSAFAQPVGANIGNPINAGTLIPGIPFSDTRNNSPANGYGNDMGQLSDDIYYKFSLSSSTEVSISHCSSAFDTYMHLIAGTIRHVMYFISRNLILLLATFFYL